jgi:ATP-binding cassette subfamily F protein uup
MTLLLSCQTISKSFGGRQLFKEISLGIFKGDKIGIIGPNGSGKTTFLKILGGQEASDSGSVTGNKSLRIGYVPQESIFSSKSIEEILLDSLNNSPLSQREKETQVTITLSKMGFKDPDVIATSLSGGWKKRLDIAKELVRSPDILLLDEPTNHLDLEGILWLEKFLKNATFSYLIISHDRYFLENVTTRMAELNNVYPKGIFTIEGSYLNFLEKREEFIKGQKQQEHSLSSKVRREIEWLKQNPKARTTKSSARIQEAHALIGDLNELKGRNKQSKNQFDFSSNQTFTRKLITTTNLSKSMGDKVLFSGINLTLAPGMRLGIVGLNGSGKTTLLRLLAGELTPDKGTVKYADGVRIVYFDQHRDQFAPDTPLRQALSPDGETVNYRGKSIHVNAWCKRFLFDPDRLDLPFNRLSGGEKARVHIARLMIQPADVLLLDEPTNDLDIPTLEILEESLVDFPGAIVLISHDRYMLDQISNVILGLGTASDASLFADYRQWETFQQNQRQQQKQDASNKTTTDKKEANLSGQTDSGLKKMSYAEKREWEQIENKISGLENEIRIVQEQLQGVDPSNTGMLQNLCESLATKQTLLDHLYKRWEELEKKVKPIC